MWKDPVIVSRYIMKAIPADGVGKEVISQFKSQIPEVSQIVKQPRNNIQN